MTWKLPSPGNLNLNVDVSIRVRFDASIGGVVRDEFGGVRWCYAEACNNRDVEGS